MMREKEFTMIDHAIHMAAIFFVEKRLGLLREQYIVRVIEKDIPEPDYWDKGLDKILTQLSLQTSNGSAPDESGGSENKESQNKTPDLKNGPQKLTYKAILKTHETLRNIPFVGQPEYLVE